MSDGHDIYRMFRVSLGWCAAAGRGRRIRAVVLPLPDRDAVEERIRRTVPSARPSRYGLRAFVEAIERYFDGWRTEFGEFVPDLRDATGFQRRVYEIARSIPYGEVRTYRWVGMEMGRPEAVRAIAGALAANPCPLVVPCHRVVNSDGTLGGFSAGGGTEMKARLLELERVPMFGEGKGRRVMARPGARRGW